MSCLRLFCPLCVFCHPGCSDAQKDQQRHWNWPLAHESPVLMGGLVGTPRVLMVNAKALVDICEQEREKAKQHFQVEVKDRFGNPRFESWRCEMISLHIFATFCLTCIEDQMRYYIDLWCKLRSLGYIGWQHGCALKMQCCDTFHMTYVHDVESMMYNLWCTRYYLCMTRWDRMRVVLGWLDFDDFTCSKLQDRRRLMWKWIVSWTSATKQLPLLHMKKQGSTCFSKLFRDSFCPLVLAQ